ncbi:hypothetical protein [Xanthocytophaga agilis]|uniref:Uncharacterized protein n=1 Tax=Xanthocytophaga agilis TaxID=3048010 RepID=A0AAE3RCQ2_9BACT|nr:hypothetical protein [Xanthocytophaga agilis]MDJ1506050.1 hypothetical protein [Xanthocytophaga agilis]
MKDTLNFDWLYIVKSKDQNLCLISWDTRMGGSMIEYATMALFKDSNNQLKSRLLIDSTDKHLSNSYMHYDTIYTVNQKDEIFYLAQGFGQGSSSLPWQEIKALEIKNNKLIDLRIFPDYSPDIFGDFTPGFQNKLFVEFDLHKFGDNDKVPEIRLQDKGKTILVPLPTHEEGFSGKYQRLIFKDGNYHVKQYK